MKVLYVEDNPANVFLVKRVARMGNHEIVNYIDGDKALEKFDEINPDLVLMDIQLAGSKSGLDVVKALRARGVKTPVIAVTAYAMVGDKERCIAAGCDDYLPKPLPIQRLVEMFKDYAEAASKANPVTEKNTDDAQTVAKPGADNTSTEVNPGAGKNAATITNKTTETVTNETATQTAPKVTTAETASQASPEVTPIAQNNTDDTTATESTSGESRQTKSDAVDNQGNPVDSDKTTVEAKESPTTSTTDTASKQITNTTADTVATPVKPIDNAEEVATGE